MKGFFQESQIKNKENDQPWKRSETDRFIELYLAGTPPNRIAVAMERNRKAIHRRVEAYTYNERDLVTRYEPFRRTSRKGKRKTQNEILMLKAWRERKVPAKAQARFLQREVKELGLDNDELRDLVDMKRVGVGVDLVMAYRYLYYVQGISILSDVAYDELEKEEIEFGAHGDLLRTPGSDRNEDYPEHIRALAIYLVFKYGKSKDDATKKAGD